MRSLDAQQVTIEINDAHRVSGLLLTPARRKLAVLAHDAVMLEDLGPQVVATADTLFVGLMEHHRYGGIVALFRSAVADGLAVLRHAYQRCYVARADIFGQGKLNRADNLCRSEWFHRLNMTKNRKKQIRKTGTGFRRSWTAPVLALWQRARKEPRPNPHFTSTRCRGKSGWSCFGRHGGEILRMNLNPIVTIGDRI